MQVFIVKFKNMGSLGELLDRLGASKAFSKQKKIVIKPNLITNIPYPVTTDPALVEQVILYIRNCSNAKIIIAEGSGDDTERNFKELGYTKLAERYGIELIDLNSCETVLLKNPRAECLKQFHFPKALLNSFLVSFACLKHHHAAYVTLSLKNMFGIAPGKIYSFNIRGKPWAKEALHDLGLEQCIVDINLYKMPDLALIDGRIAQLGAEMGGPTKKLGLLFGSWSAIAADAIAAEYLGFEKVSYIEKLAKLYNIDLSKIKIIKC